MSEQQATKKVSNPEKISKRVSKLRAATGLSQDDFAKLLGVSRNYVSMIENGREPSEALLKLISRLEKEYVFTSVIEEDANAYSIEARPQSDARILGPVDEIFVGTVPVISWAHAGEATSYEEIPEHWQERIPTLCKGKRAFGLVIEGDSMEPKCEPNDVVIVDPDAELRNGCLVVAKLKDDGVVLRRFTRLEAGRVKLIPYNPIYPAVEYFMSAFHWIYPVHSSFRRELS